MKTVIGLFAGLAIAGFAVASATNNPSCGTVTYEKSSDFSDSRVSINFESNDSQIDVAGAGGWSVTKVWLDVSDDGHSGFWQYATGPVNNFNPNPGASINAVKAEVNKPCPTPSPSPSATPSSTPSPSASPTPTPSASSTPEPTPSVSPSATVTPPPTETPNECGDCHEPEPSSEPKKSGGGGGGSLIECSESWLKYVGPNNRQGNPCVTPTPVAPVATPNITGAITKISQVPTGAADVLLALGVAALVTAGAAVAMKRK